MAVRAGIQSLLSKLPRIAEVQAMSEDTSLLEQPSSQTERRCVICRAPATRLVDGDPSCEAHANLVYENQLEDYTRAHQS